MVFASLTFITLHALIPIPVVGTVVAAVAAGAVGGFIAFGYLSLGVVVGYGMQTAGFWITILGILSLAIQSTIYYFIGTAKFGWMFFIISYVGSAALIGIGVVLFIVGALIARRV